MTTTPFSAGRTGYLRGLGFGNEACVPMHRLTMMLVGELLSLIVLFSLSVNRYVHRSRRFGGDFVSTAVYDSYHRTSSVSTNASEYSAINYPKSSSSSSPTASLKTPYTCHLRRHNHSYLQKRKVTIVLIFCLCVALLLWTPQSLSLTYETMIESYSEMSSERRILLLIFNNFANLFLCINASIDFILYCFLSENFARTCKQIVCRQCSNYNTKFSQRSRFISFDRTSFVIHAPSNNVYQHQQQQQQSAANNTNNYYAQLYNNRRSSSIIKLDCPENKRWKKRIVQTTTTTRTTSTHSRRRHRMYQTPLLEHAGNAPKRTSNEYRPCPLEFRKSSDITSNVDDECAQSELNESVHTLVSSNRQWRSETISNA